MRGSCSRPTSGRTDKRIAEALDLAPITVGRVRQRYAAEEVDVALATSATVR